MPPKRIASHKVNPLVSRSFNSEKMITKKLLNGFVAKGSKGESLIEDIFGCQINEITILGIAQVATVFSEMIGINLNRNYKRSKLLLVKWFDENEKLIKSYKSHIKIDFYDQAEI